MAVMRCISWWGGPSKLPWLRQAGSRQRGKRTNPRQRTSRENGLPPSQLGGLVQRERL